MFNSILFEVGSPEKEQAPLMRCLFFFCRPIRGISPGNASLGACIAGSHSPRGRRKATRAARHFPAASERILAKGEIPVFRFSLALLHQNQKGAQLCSFLILRIYGTTMNPARPTGVARVCSVSCMEKIVWAHAGIQSSRWVTIANLN